MLDLTATLAQLGFDAPVLPALPKAPLLERWLFESPWVPAAGAVVLALAIWWSLRRTHARAAWLVLAGGGLLACGVVTLATLSVTERERLAVRTRALIGAVAVMDADTAGALLDERATVRSRWFRGGMSRENTLDAIATGYGGRAMVDRHEIRDTRSGLRPDGSGVTLVRVLVWPEDVNAPIGTWWRLDWIRREGEDWRALSIEPLWFAGFGDVSSRGQRR